MVIAYQFKWCDTPLAPFIEDLTTSSLQFVCQFPTKFYHTNTWYKSTANFFPHWSSCFFSKSISCLLYITRHPFWHNSYPTYLMYIWRRVKGAINTGNSAFLSENIRHGNGRYACCSNFLMLVFISTKFNHLAHVYEILERRKHRISTRLVLQSSIRPKMNTVEFCGCDNRILH